MEERLRKLRQVYAPGHPCPPELFVGRKEYLDYCKVEVLVPKYEGITPAPANAAFLGVWGIGKTSILKYIAESKAFEEGGFVNLPIIQDFKAIDDLLARALENITTSVSRIEWLKAKVGKKLESISLAPVSLKLGVDRRTLTDHLIQTWSILESAGVQHCSILIDDFHKLSYEDMFSLRSIFQFLPRDGCNYSLVVSGALWTFLAEPTEPVARFFDKKPLAPFTPKEVEEAIWKPVELFKIDLSFDEKYVDELMKMTLGHPYFVKFITLELAKRYTKIKGKHIGEHSGDLLGALGKAKFEDDYRRASAGEQKVLKCIAEKGLGEKFEAKELKEIKGYPAYLERLCEKELLNKEMRGVYSVYHPLFLEWIRRSAT